MPTLLTIAGFDPSSGAGMTADLTVFHAHGLFGTACITALTVQSTLGVAAAYPADVSVVRETLACLDEDLPPDGVKIGMLGSAACVEAVADYLEQVRESGRSLVVVLDPVLRSSSGRPLLEEDGIGTVRDRLLPLVDWVTPNVAELGILSRFGFEPVPSLESILEAALGLQAGYGRLGVMVTGGDLQSPDDLVLCPTGLGAKAEPFWLEGERVETTSTHGTGCALSSALLCRLALGDAPLVAAEAAKRYVAGALRHANAMGHGRGPMNLLWPLMRRFPVV